MTELLKENIAKHISLSVKEANEFCDLFERRHIDKKDFLLREGEICKFEGLSLRVFSVFIILTITDLNKFYSTSAFLITNGLY